MNQGSKPKQRWQRDFRPHYDSESYRKSIGRACKRIFFGLKGYKWSPNQLRHAFAETTQSVAGLEATGALLGHNKLDTTKIYAKKNIKLAIETSKKIA